MEKEEKERGKGGHATTVAKKDILPQSAGRPEGESPKEAKEELKGQGLSDLGLKDTTRPNQARAQADTMEVKDTADTVEVKEAVKAAEVARASDADNMGI